MQNNEMTPQQVRDLIRKQVKFYGTQKATAEAWGITESYLSEVLSGEKLPGQKILDILDLEHIDKYRYKKK